MEHDNKNERIASQESIEDSNISADEALRRAREEISEANKIALENINFLESKFSDNKEIKDVVEGLRKEIERMTRAVGDNIDFINDKENLSHGSEREGEKSEQEGEEPLPQEIINQINNEQGLIELYEKDMERNNKFIDKHQIALEELKDYLDLLVSRSNFASDVGGFEWKLVEPTAEYQAISREQEQHEQMLYSQGKSFNEVYDDQDIRGYREKLSKIEESNSEMGKLLRASHGNEEIVLKSISGAIEVGGAMKLEDAFNKAIEFYTKENEKIQNNIVKYQKNIEELKNYNKNKVEQ